MKKLFSIFTVLMLVILPLCFTGCGNNPNMQIEYNVVKDWTEVQAFERPSSNIYSRIYFSYTEEECTEEEFNNAQNKLYGSASVSTGMYFSNNKQISIEQAQSEIIKIYYKKSTGPAYHYYKYTYNGFYTDIIQIKIYSNNYIEYKHVYEDYGTVDIEHHSHVEGTLNDTYRITYFE